MGVYVRREVRDAGTPILELRDAAKSYGAVHALRDGKLALRSGEVRGLVGENGAGKSTLVKILAGGTGRTRADPAHGSGTGELHNAPHVAQDAGIAIIFQEPTLFRRPERRRERRRSGLAARARAARIDGRDAPQCGRRLRSLGVRLIPTARARPLDRRPADRRDRQGADLDARALISWTSRPPP